MYTTMQLGEMRCVWQALVNFSPAYALAVNNMLDCWQMSYWS